MNIRSNSLARTAESSHLLVRESILAPPLIDRFASFIGGNKPEETDHSVQRSQLEEREPWRVFRQSLGITFTSKRHRVWSPDAIAPAVRSEILRAIEARRWITAAYTDLHSGIGQLLTTASELQAFRYSPPLWLRPSADVRRLARDVAADVQLPMQDGNELSAMLCKAEAVLERAELLAFGFIEVREEKSGSITMRFQLWKQRGTWTPAEVEAEAHAFSAFVADAVAMLQCACIELEAGAGSSKARSC